jgi:hypothetical protein
MSLQKRQATHDAILSDLEARIAKLYPNAPLLRNVTYGDLNSPVGEIDLLRVAKTYLVAYEVKTGKYKLRKAMRQIDRFRDYFPDLKIKGVYYHPKKCCRI